ncbi:MAG: hypothetical protein Q3961_04385 [Bifidobacteriaceae bacterium]|nr:hypothetical protein [Bifidobacteriaceae bacterium]
MDTISIKGIRPLNSTSSIDGFPSIFGVLHVDVQVSVSHAQSVQEVNNIVDYQQLIHRVRYVVEQRCNQVRIVEELLQEVCEAILHMPDVYSIHADIHVRQENMGVDEVVFSATRDNESDVFSEPNKASLAAAEASTHVKAGVQQHNQHEDDILDNPLVFKHAIISLISNRQDSEHAFRSAIVSLDTIKGNQVVGISPLYHVTNMSTRDEESAVISLSTSMTDSELVDLVEDISQDLGVEMHVVQMNDPVAQRSTVLYPHAMQTAAILAPWLDIEADASCNNDPVSYLLAMAPDANNVGVLTDSWILGEI